MCLGDSDSGLLFGIGTVAGPVIGGAFAQSDATWRWGFYLVGRQFDTAELAILTYTEPLRGWCFCARLHLATARL